MTRDRSHDAFGQLRRSDDEALDVRPSRARFERAVGAGRRRRRRKLALLVTGTAVALFAAGAAVLPGGGEPDGLVFTNEGVSGSDESFDASVVDTDVATSSIVPPTSSPATLVEPTAPPATLAPAPTPSTLTPGATVLPLDDVFVTVSSENTAVIDVRDALDIVASFDLTCPADRRCTVQSARVMGDTIWVAITEADPGNTDMVVRSRVMSATRSTGEVVEHLSLDGTAAVRSAGLGADGVLYAAIDDQGPADRTLVAIEAGQVRVMETGVSGFRLSDDGRFLAVSFSNPSAGEQPRLTVADLVAGTTAGFDTAGINAGPGAWSPDGRFLIVNEQWEDGTAWVVDPWSGSGEPIPGTEHLLDGACFMSERVVAHRTWNVGYGQGDAQPGVIRLTSLDTGATVAEFGEEIFGDGFRCHADGSISYLRRPVVEVENALDFTQLEPDPEAAVELVHIAADGTISTRAVGDLRMV